MKVGIIGIGAIGAVHADAYKTLKDVEIAAICDVNEERLKAEAARLGVKQTFTDYKELLKTDVDAVSVCVGNALHHPTAVAALKAGKHVLLEKPMAMNAKQALDIVQTAKKMKRTLQIGMVYRQRPAVQTAREYVQKGLLGEIYHMRTVLIRRRGIPGLGGWFTTKKLSGGGPMIDLGVHWFDAAMYVSGLWKPTAVSAQTYAKFGSPLNEYVYVGMWAGPPKLDGTFDVEDYSTGFIRFGKNATMVFDIAWAANTEDCAYIDILGKKGGVRLFDSTKPFVFYTEYNGKIADITPKFNEQVNMFALQAQSFIKACQGKAEPFATGEQGLTVMKLLDAVYKSSEMHKEVEIK